MTTERERRESMEAERCKDLVRVIAKLEGSWEIYETSRSWREKHGHDPDERHYWVKAIREDDLAIRLGVWHQDAGIDKITASGEYCVPFSSFAPYGTQPPKINFSCSRSLSAKAGEITRRLLPDVEKWTKLAEEKKAQDDEYHRLREEAFRALEAEGCERRADRPDSIYLSLGSSKGYVRNIQIQPDSVSLDIRSLPLDIAVKIVRILRSMT